MPANHVLRCLGQPVLLAPNGEPIRFRTKKHLALLVYLAIEGPRNHRRDRLAEFLWPRAQLAEGRHSLATALSVLRPRVGTDVLETTRDSLKLHTGWLDIDVDRLRAFEAVSFEASGGVEAAPFLEGFEIPDAPEFALWKDRQQARILPRLKEVLVKLIAEHRRSGGAQFIERLADRLLALDDLSEDGIRAKMEARAWAGDRLQALQLFEEWKKRLHTELRASPSDTLEQIAASLRRGGWERAPINDFPIDAQDRARERSFVGRADEYRRLYDTWEGLRHRKPVHSLVLGDSGVGKTTLVERFTTAAGFEGAAVARVQSYGLDSNIPFATLASLGLSALTLPGASATPSEALAEIARVVPEVRRRFPFLPSAGESQGETARVRLTEAFQEMLLAISEERPLILSIDDLHLADEASLAALLLILRRSADHPILAILTGRFAELGRSNQATILRENLLRLGGQELTLGPLTPRQSSDLLETMLGAHQVQPSPTIRRSLITASGGYPMALELLVQNWRVHGPHSVAIGLDGMTANFAVRDDPRAAYDRLVSRLTESFGTVTKKTLDLAAVLGRRLNDLSMYSLVDLTLGQTMAALGQLSDTRILREGEHGLEFTNELVRAHAYSSISSPVRKALHASILDRLQRSENGLGPLVGLELAWHTIRAGRTQEALPLLMEGAKSAMHFGAPQSAESALLSALNALDLDMASISELTVLLAQALQEQGRWGDSLEVLERINQRTCEDKSDQMFALSALAKGYSGVAASEELLQLLPRLEEIIRSCPDALSRVRAARAVAHGLSVLRDRSLGQRLLTLVNAIPDSELDVSARGELTLARAIFLFQAGKIEESYLEAERGLNEMRAAGAADVVVAHLLAGLGFNRSLQGRYGEATHHYEASLAMASRLGNDALVASTLSNLTIVFLRIGRTDQCVACGEQVKRLGRSTPPDWNDVTRTYAVAMAHAIDGHVVEARQELAALESRLPAELPSALLQRWLLWKADVLMLTGARSEAMCIASKAVAGYRFEVESLGIAGAFARWAAVTCLGSDLEPEARKTLERLEHSLEGFDALDQLEILGSASYLGVRSAIHYSESIEARCHSLPAFAVRIVRSLGLTSIPVI